MRTAQTMKAGFVGLIVWLSSCTQVAGIREGTLVECAVVNGQIDEGCVCEPGGMIQCYTGPPGTEDIGACHSGMQACNADGLGYGPCLGEQTPGAETCDAVQTDEDCDGEVNEEGTDCVCGDGYLSAGEDCDDGNTDNCDGCRDDCTKSCGDGSLCGSETCDDGGTSDGDPCSPTCQMQEVLQVAGGTVHTCALLTGGVVKCWGENEEGELGLGDTWGRGWRPNQMGNNLPAVDLGTGKTALAISAGENHTCALLNDASVKCWGNNYSGQLGVGDTEHRGWAPNEMGDNLPAVSLGSGKTALAISVGSNYTCALLNDASVKCWGNNYSGRLGVGDTEHRGDGPNEMGDSLPAVSLGAGKTALAISAGGIHTCALLNDASVKCWGSNWTGTLGVGDTEDRGAGLNEMGDNLPAVSLGTGKTALAISAGWGYTCALLNDASVKCWGWNGYGELGLGDTEDRGDGPNEMGDSLPTVSLGTGKTTLAISAGSDHTCALLNDASVKCWGNNYSGQLGVGDTEGRGDGPNEMDDNLPAMSLGTGKTAFAISAGRWHTCVLLNDSSIKCWGDNFFGQLGLGDIENRGDDMNEMNDNLPTVKLFSALW